LKVDGRYSGGKLLGAARFDLGKTKHVAIERYEVDLAGNLYADTASADGRLEISHYQPVASSFEIAGCEIFAVTAEIAGRLSLLLGFLGIGRYLGH
jgi:hypothetical protein